MRKAITYMSLLTLGIAIGASNFSSLNNNNTYVFAKKVSKKHKKKSKSKLSKTFKQSVKTMVNNLNQQSGDTLSITKIKYPGSYGVKYVVDRNQWDNLSDTDKSTFADGIFDDTTKIASMTSQPTPGVTIVDDTNTVLSRSKLGGGMKIIE